MTLVLILLGCMGASAFFALLFHVPGRCVLPASLVGLAGYGAYLVALHLGGSPVAGSFLGAIVISLLSEFLARQQRAPAVIYVSVGIIPLVPGGGLYQTMFTIIQSEHSRAVRLGAETLLVAGGIALAIALVSAFVHAFSKQNSE